MGGRINIKPDNIAQLVDELRVVGKLELVDPVRLETMRAPDALDGTRADTDGFRQWVASTGASVRVSATTRWAISDPSGGMREGRAVSLVRVAPAREGWQGETPAVSTTAQ